MAARRTTRLSALGAVAWLALVCAVGPARAQDRDGGAAAAPGATAAGATEIEPAPLRVVVAGSPPFVAGERQADGLSVDIWTAVAKELGVSFELASADTVADAIDQVAGGDADVAIGPISITAERARRVAFSQPYFQSHLSIAAAPEESWFDRVKPFLTMAFLSGLGGLLLVLVIVGVLVWLAERRRNPDDFPDRPVAGIGNGVWMALVTMTTVGYGDRVPRTVAGRIVTGVWMLISMLIAGSIIAFLSTALTMSQLGGGGITSAEDLRDRPVAVVEGTTSLRFARRAGARPVVTGSLEQAMEAVGDGRADAVVFDRPALGYYLGEHPSSPLVMADARYEPTGYGFAMSLDSALRHRMDVAILELQRTDRLASVIERWLGRD